MSLFEIVLVLGIIILVLIIKFTKPVKVQVTEEEIEDAVKRVGGQYISNHIKSDVHRLTVEQCANMVKKSYNMESFLKKDIPEQVANKLFLKHKESLLAEINSEAQLDMIVDRIRRKQV